MITGAADLGNGKCEFVSDSSLINEKVISLLKSSFAKRFYNFSLEYDSNFVDKIVPDPKSISFLRESEPFQIFVFFKAGTK